MTAENSSASRPEYDDPVFFAQYAQMSRSRQGLAAAGEWPQFSRMFPPLEGRRVLDLGCGYGWHCRFAAEQGAKEVLGLDLSEKMLEKARSMGGGIRYRLCGIEDYEYPKAAWDLVVSNLALHYVEDLDRVFALVHRTLAEGGAFLFNIEHPVFTAGVGQDWVRGPDGVSLYWPVDGYFLPGERSTNFLGCPVVKQHHTLTQILMGLRRAGFALDWVEEAQPPENMLDLPGMKDELRRPMMLMVRAQRE